ncbi:MAG: ribose 5-phosphate isomerase B [Desulfobacterales bacterium]|nr:MAG: ribose 5-phosphate isomerase B [Desulfobacterales bacterium]
MIENKPTIVIGADHAAYDLKETVKGFLVEMGTEVHDVGTHGKESVDYPDFGIMVASTVSKGKFKRGILLCGTGIGMSMVANKFPNVRAALCNDIFSAVMSRRHNDANILILGGRIIGDILALEIVKTWVETPFEGGRHQARLDKIDGIDQKELINSDPDG